MHNGPIDFKKWIEDNRSSLKPPVGNKVVWPQGEFLVMVVGGPNQRTDFHVNEGPEFFYQLEGRLVLRIINEQGKRQDIAVGAGEIYLLAPKTPHSPQREAGSVGLVIEARRQPGQRDALQWYCEKCEQKLYEESFVLTNIEEQFPPVFKRYYDGHTGCRKCGHSNPKC